MRVELKCGLTGVAVFPETLDEKEFMGYYSDTVRRGTYRKFAGQKNTDQLKRDVQIYIESLFEQWYCKQGKGVENGEGT